jgi:opacity protein-like surface antigen
MKKLAAILSTGTILLSASAQVVDFDALISGDEPSSPVPARLWIEDLGDDLSITFEGSGLTGNESIKTLWLNLPNNVTVAPSGKSGSFADPQIKGPGSQNGFGDNYRFDWKFDFFTAADKRFGAGESFTFTVNGMSSLDLEDLLVFSGTQRPLLGGVHVIGLQDGDSAKVGADELVLFPQTAVPEPQAFAWIAGLGLVAYSVWRRRPGARTNGAR